MEIDIMNNGIFEGISKNNGVKHFLEEKIDINH